VSTGSSNIGDGSDLVGDLGSGGSAGGSSSNDPGANAGALGAVNQGIGEANKDKQEQQNEAERKTVKALKCEYEAAREFDKPQRSSYAKDRKYAAGMSDPSWASDANIIGSIIDIMTSFLYAQNPDVSCKGAVQAGGSVDPTGKQLAETLEIAISRLWKVGKLKKAAKRTVRSALSVGIGWFKAVMWSDKRPQPQVEKTLHDAEATMGRLTLLMGEIREGDEDADTLEVQKQKLAFLIAGLRAKLELQKEYGLNIDFVRAEDMQVSLDVSSMGDYTSADWLSEDMYIPQAVLRARFPRFSDEDEKRATVFYQKNATSNTYGDASQVATGEAASDGTYSKSTPGSPMGGNKPQQFVKIVEFWDRRDGQIKTVCDGIDRWAIEPYSPPQASNRYYPYFGLELFPVDGQRHAQSLAFRLRKLQDEYSACRSNQRLTRERSIPGTIFNAGVMSVEDAKKLESSVIGEMVGIRPTDITLPIQNIVMEKKIPTIDVRLWDTTPINRDMESLSGVQEALQQNASQQPKTATEAQIQQTGFASRTSADRDCLEDVLVELAQYTAETSIQSIDGTAIQRICGPAAFWPFGMDVQDLLTMVDVDIEAGTSGKPNVAADKANWSTILPLLQKIMVQVRQVQETDPPLAECLTNLLRETLKRLDDRLDIDDFIAKTPPPPQQPPQPPPPSVSISLKGELPVLDAALIGAKAAGLPPEAIGAAGGVGAPTSIKPGAPDHPGAHVADGEIPLHPHMPQPLPAAQKTPAQGGDTQKPQA
jgi:hypothetical protein